MSHWTNPALLAGRRVKPAFANLAKLFAGGADELMVDFTDVTTLFQDANAALPVSANGQGIGLALDQHKWGGKTLAEYRAAQPELMLSGKFDADITGWSLANASNGALSWQAPGKLRTTANNGNTPGAVSPGFTCVVGRWYELSLDIVTAHSSYTGFAIGTTSGGGQTYSSGNLFNAPGFYRRFFKSTATTQYITLYGPGGGGNIAEFDNVSVKEIDGHHLTQVSTGRPAWASATGDVAFNGTSHHMISDFLSGSGSCFAAAYHGALGNLSADRCAIGAYNGSNAHMQIGLRMTTGKGYMRVTNAAAISGSTTITGLTDTLLADKGGTDHDLFVNGAIEGTAANSGSLPTATPFFVGALNSNGSAASRVAGNRA